MKNEKIFNALKAFELENTEAIKGGAKYGVVGRYTDLGNGYSSITYTDTSRGSKKVHETYATGTEVWGYIPD